ncbi:MAG: glycosyltransferase [Vicinamibacterales bacterium]
MSASPTRLLVIAYNFPPHGAIGTMRTLRLVRHVAAEGWCVRVVTGDPSTYVAGTPTDDALLASVPATVRVDRVRAVRPWRRLSRWLKRSRGPASSTSPVPTMSASPAPAPAQRRPTWARELMSLGALPDGESGWLVPALLAALLGPRPDAIYSTAPPWTSQVVALAAHAWLGRPWVADFRDPWARAPWREARTTVQLRASTWLERRVVSRATTVVFATAANRDEYVAVYGETLARKSVVIPNGCDVEEFAGLERGPARQEFVLLHAGSLYGGRNPLPLFRGLARAIEKGLVERRTFRLRLLGATSIAGVDVTSAIAELGLTDVIEFVARVPRRQSLVEILSADALLIVQPATAVSVPGKLYEYFAAGRPILALTVPGETASLVERSGIGVAVSATDEDAIAAGLHAVVALSRRAPAPAPRSLYDGKARAADAAHVLRAAIAGASDTHHPRAGRRDVATAIEEPERNSLS